MTLKNAQGHALTLKHKPRTWKYWSYIELEIAKGNPESPVIGLLTFIENANGDISDSRLYLGFNISRAFSLKGKDSNSW